MVKQEGECLDQGVLVRDLSLELVRFEVSVVKKGQREGGVLETIPRRGRWWAQPEKLHSCSQHVNMVFTKRPWWQSVWSHLTPGDAPRGRRICSGVHSMEKARNSLVHRTLVAREVSGIRKVWQ